MNGYIILPRDITHLYLWTSTPFDRMRAFIDLLILASYKERTVKIRKTEFILKPGELAYSTLSLAKRWHRSRHFVCNVLREFISEGMISVKGNSCTSIISIPGWGKLSILPENAGHPNTPETEQDLGQVPDIPISLDNNSYYKNFQDVFSRSCNAWDTKRVQPNPQTRVHKQEGIKNLKKKYASDEASSLAAFLLSEIRRNNPFMIPKDGAMWDVTFGRMILDDMVPPDVLHRLVAFSQKHPFWMKQITSPYKLKVHFHKVLLDMQEEEKKNNKLVPASMRLCYEK